MKNIAVLCPGQGAQYIGMGKKLYQEFKIVKQIFEEANDVLGFDLAKMCFDGDLEELTRTENAQPAILTYSYAAYRVYSEKFSWIPGCYAGHSLGEYTALVCSKVIDFADAVKIVRKRGQFMQEAAGEEGSMAAVMKCSKEELEDLCRECSKEEEKVSVSNYNSSTQMVISGHKKAVERVVGLLDKKSIVSKYLTVSAPFHSIYMMPAAKKLEEELLKYQYHKIEVPVISNYTAKPYESADKVIENLTQQLVNPVRWVETMEYMKCMRMDTSVEVGPKNVLTNIMKKDVKGIVPFAMDMEKDVEALENYMKPQIGEPTVVTRCMAIAVCTKNQNWDNEVYKQGVSIPYKEIEMMQDEIEKEEKYPTKEQMLKALNMLKSVFRTKGTQAEEQKERYEQIFRETGTKDLLKDFNMEIN